MHSRIGLWLSCCAANATGYFVVYFHCSHTHTHGLMTLQFYLLVSFCVVSRELQHPILCNEFIVPLGGCCVLSCVLCVLFYASLHFTCPLSYLVISVRDMTMSLISIKIIYRLLYKCLILDLYFALAWHTAWRSAALDLVRHVQNVLIRPHGCLKHRSRQDGH